MATSMHYGAKKAIFQFAYALRKNMTPAETKLWDRLRKKSIGYRFKSQHPIWIYVVDFYCHEMKLFIEIDGSIHLIDEVSQNDKDRESNLLSLGLHIIRFSNDEVLNDIETVMKKIEEKIAEIINFKTDDSSNSLGINEKERTIISPLQGIQGQNGTL